MKQNKTIKFTEIEKRIAVPKTITYMLCIRAIGWSYSISKMLENSKISAKYERGISKSYNKKHMNIELFLSINTHKISSPKILFRLVEWQNDNILLC